MRVGLIAAVAVTGLIAAAPAQAAKGTYAGTVTNTTGKVAFDVKISRLGIVKKITELRGDGIPSNCEVSGPIPSINFDLPATVSIKSNGRFSGIYTQPDYGNESTLGGRIKHKQMKGTIRVNYHYPAEGQYPEENCDTGPLSYTAKLGAPDETTPSRPNWR